MPVDILGREINVDDFVVYFGEIYQVIAPVKIQRHSFIRMLQVRKSKSTRPVNKLAHECCLVDRDAVLVHLLKTGTV